MKKALLLIGEGIECEKETRRLLERPEIGFEVVEVPVFELLRNAEKVLEKFSRGDWVFFAGGFSYADHFGSGRLLAFRLKQAGIFEKLYSKGLHLVGICNGFQVLCEAGCFGEGVRLRANENNGERLGFIDRWVDCSTADGIENFKLCIRHGEGRLVRQSSLWPKNVEPFLRYCDTRFDNGSVDQVAGLRAQHGDSSVWGLMPHPEVSVRQIDRPDSNGPDYSERTRGRCFEVPDGSGVHLMKKILEGVKNA